jgi:flavin-dependent dehydrogenase
MFANEYDVIIIGGGPAGIVGAITASTLERHVALVDNQALLEDLPEEGIVITKHGQPVARVAPVRPVRKGKRVTLPLGPWTSLPQHGDAVRARI